MKFNYININKVICVLASSIIVLNIGGCQKIEKNNENIYQNEIIENQQQINEYTDSDMKVINKFKELETSLDNLLNSETVANVKIKAKEIFITTVDFIFYDGEINEITFDELSDKGKEKILNIASSIDNKIENKFPDYKETISSKSNDVLDKASELINKGILNINEFSKDKLGDKYNEFVETKNEIIKSTKETLEDVTSIGKETYEKGKEYIKTWYEDFKK